MNFIKYLQICGRTINLAEQNVLKIFEMIFPKAKKNCNCQ